MKVPVKVPQDVELLIQSGQIVDFSTPFMRQRGRKKVEVPLARMLNFAPDKIFLVLKKVIGESVKKGELLAEQKAFLATRQYFSEMEGIIKEINHNTGSVIMELNTGEPLIVNCFFNGEIETINDDHIEVKVKNVHRVDTARELDHYTGTEIYYLPESGQFSEDDIEDKYIYTAVINPLDQVKVEALGAKGYITDTKKPIHGSIKQIVVDNPEDFAHIAQKKYPFCIVGLDNRSIYFYS